MAAKPLLSACVLPVLLEAVTTTKKDIFKQWKVGCEEKPYELVGQDDRKRA